MSQLPSLKPASQDDQAAFLQSLPRQPLTSSQQIEALRRLQSQAEQRVALGQQLLATAEAKLTEWRTREKQVKAVACNAVADMLNSDDPGLRKLLDERIARAIEPIERRLAAMEKTLAADKSQINQMVGESKQLMAQSKAMLNQSRQKLVGAAPASTPPTAKAAADPGLTQPSSPTADAVYSKLLGQMRGEPAVPPQVDG